MSTLQFYLKNVETGNHEYVLDPVETFHETEEHWVVDNGWGVYEVSKAEFPNCKAYIRLTPADDNPLYRMRDHLIEIGSSVAIDWS